MRMNRSVFFLVAPSLLIASLGNINSANAAQEGSGRVNMEGAIIDAACAIDVGSRDQSIDMGVHPVSQVSRDGRLPPQPFSIKLVDCRLERGEPNKPAWQKFQVTFSGNATGERFNMQGDARGINMRILDSQGSVMMPGIASLPADIIPGSMTLNYTLDMVGNGEVMRSGAYRSTIRFKMDYY
ncbi:type 1 fimbrial protein [Serratia sp. JSRIV001]|nr:type 1 fimbrial protein [Serratia sp. JSRIV001]